MGAKATSTSLGYAAGSPPLVDYTIEEICAEVRGGRRVLVCFGAGLALRNMLKRFAGHGLASFVTAVVDNAAVLGSKAYVPGTSIPILTLEEILTAKRGPLLLLVTTRYLSEVCGQLQGIPALADSTVAFYGFVTDQYDAALAKTESMGEMPAEETGVAIPRVFHYCWFGGKPLPERYRDWMESWRRFCPGYEIVEWNESNYDLHANRYMEEAYEAGKWGFVPDYARLDIIYRHGGIYLDTDVELLRPLDGLLRQQGFAGFEHTDAVNLGHGFGAVPGHPAIKGMRDAYDGLSFRRADGTLNQLPSPAYQTEWLVGHGLRLDGRRQRVAGLTIYPASYFSPLAHYSRRLLTDRAYAIHHYDGSWVDAREKRELQGYPAIYAQIARA